MVNQVRGNKIHPAPKHASANKVHPAPKHADHSATARRPTNAWKHGGHSNLGVLPGEDPEEFDRHHQSLIGEFKPSGPTECDIVLSLAKCMWRKSRLGFYAQAAAARLKWSEVFEGRNNPYWTINTGLNKHSVLNFIRLRDDVLPQWLEVAEINKEVMPRLDKINKELTAHLEIDEKGVQELAQKQELELELANLGEQITVETLDQEIELNSRLDARIDRLLKRLFQVKAAKQMIGLGSGSPEAAAAPREIASSPCDQAAKPPVTHPRSQPQ